MSGGLLQSGEFYAAAAALLWGLAVIWFRRSGYAAPPVALNVFKSTLALALFLVTLPLVGVAYAPPDATSEDWARLIGSGVLGIAVSDSLFFASLNRLGAGRSAIVDCSYSPLILLLPFVFLGEPVGPALVVGVLLMAGAIVLATWQPGVPAPAQERRELRTGVLLGFGAMLTMGVGVIVAKPVLVDHDAWWTTTVRLAGGVAVLAVQSLLPRHRAAVAAAFRSRAVWRAAVPATLLGSYAALLCWILGFKLAQTTVASVLNQLSTVFVLLFAALFLKERLTPAKAVAVVLGVTAGVVVSL